MRGETVRLVSFALVVHRKKAPPQLPCSVSLSPGAILRELSMDDAEFLKDFAETRSDATFKAVVDRHINLVYSAALHTTRDAHLAEEVAQTVFIILAKKAEIGRASCRERV